MADDALTRKDAEMGKMTEARLAWARECGRDNLPCPSDRELDAFNEGFKRAQALSLESVREEALEEAIKRCEVVRDSSDRLGGHYMGAIDCIAALRALQSPARVAEGLPCAWCDPSFGCFNLSAPCQKRAPESPAKEQPGEQTCPHCKGSGDVKGMTQGHGPDDYEIDLTCPACKGTGVIAAPDVAAMVKRLRDACVDYDGSQEVDAAEAVHPPTCGMLRKAAALLEKIGQQRQSESEHPSNYEFPPERP